MPKLLGYRERVKFNYYDAVLFGREYMKQLADGDGSLGLFGNKNVGLPTLTNTNGAFGGQDTTMLITNWYVRTNLQPSPQLKSWLNSAVATLVIGARAQSSMSFADLVQRTEDDELPAEIDYEALFTELARVAYDAHWFDRRDDDLTVPPFHKLSHMEQERWRRSACDVHAFTRSPVGFLCPVRQSMWVSITFDPKATGELLESIPTDINFNPGVWVHLEGVAVRDVA